MRATIRLALSMAIVAMPASLAAQGLTVQSVSDVRFQGALGTIAGIAERFGGRQHA